MPDALTHLLVPTDFRPASRAAARLALEMAYGSQARVTLLHVIPEEPLEGLDAIGYLHRVLWLPDGPGRYTPVFPNTAACERLVLARLEREMHPEWQQALKIQAAVRRGDVATEVARFAQEEVADLIVVGVNRPGWRLSLRPRQSARIVRLADRPVVLVPRVPAAVSQVEPA